MIKINNNEFDIVILLPEKVHSLTGKEDANHNTEKLSKLPIDIAGLVEIDINVEEMKDVQGVFYLSVLLQMFYPSNVNLSSALKNYAKFTGKQVCWGLFFNRIEG